MLTVIFIVIITILFIFVILRQKPYPISSPKFDISIDPKNFPIPIVIRPSKHIIPIRLEDSPFNISNISGLLSSNIEYDLPSPNPLEEIAFYSEESEEERLLKLEAERIIVDKIIKIINEYTNIDPIYSGSTLRFLKFNVDPDVLHLLINIAGTQFVKGVRQRESEFVSELEHVIYDIFDLYDFKEIDDIEIFNQEQKLNLKRKYL